MDEWPALLVGPDMLQRSENLNGRRWSGSALLTAWVKHRKNKPVHFACNDPNFLKQITPLLEDSQHKGERSLLSITDPKPFCEIGSLFIPDPSLGLWSRWRSQCNAERFSLIGQIHTLSTNAALRAIESLAYEQVMPWDALICTSKAGKEVVEKILANREELIISRFGGSPPTRPLIPVIPLPVAVRDLKQSLPNRKTARASLGIPLNAFTCLWLGRLSLLTKSDPWLMYRVLQTVAQKNNRDLWLIECGPDDTQAQAEHFERLRKLCPNIQFIRLGGQHAVSEHVKHHALAAANVAISLVDNCQETFGLSLVEAMAAGLPVIASDWDGYKDLVREGIDGFRVPSRWVEGAETASKSLAWWQELGIHKYPVISGCLAQLVAIDVEAAVAVVETLLNNPVLVQKMGEQAQRHILNYCDSETIMNRYSDLFEELNQSRNQIAQPVRNDWSPITLNPVKLFGDYATQNPQSSPESNNGAKPHLPDAVKEGRESLWNIILETSSTPSQRDSLLKGIASKQM